MGEPRGAVTGRGSAPLSWLLRGLATPFVGLLLFWPGLLLPGGQPEVAPAHGRPYFMPPAERARILMLIQGEPWARAERERLQAAVQKGDGYAAALLYAVEGDPANLPPARMWLLQYGRQGGDLGKRALDAGPEFFRGGQPWLGDVYYNIDVGPLIAYDWVYVALRPEERQIIEDGILASARFRMHAMDRWSQTPNLVFKPTFMVAMAGLVTGNRELIEWGFHRKPGSARGGYFSTLEVMLRDEGPWGEAPIYPVAHKDLLIMTVMSRSLEVLDGRDWFSRTTPGGGSPKGLMNYYLDTAYPIERTGLGAGQVRVATYGDGSTSAEGDLFLVNPAGPGLDLHEELAEAYAASRDPRYAAFLAMLPGYQPDLVRRQPLPADPPLPPAPSRVWPYYGLAMLRSDESPAYWTSGKAMAVLQVMTQGYGHDHRDKFGITLHGAGRLLYPDYNAIQYENPSIGWSRNSVAHNTLVVDEADTRNAAPTGIRHDFTPAVKFLATSASGVFEGVDETRVLLLTGEYLLDLFHATSAVPHTYDYLLHSFGQPRQTDQRRFAPTDALRARYWLLEHPTGTHTADAWSLDFVLDGAAAHERDASDRRWVEDTLKRKPGPPLRYRPEWYEHTASARVTMAADPDTLVAYGVGMQDLPMLVARRTGRRDTLFAVTHEPFANEERPGIEKVTVLARTADAVVVRVDARDYTDYAAVTFGPQADRSEHVLASATAPRVRFGFRSYGYLRVLRNGTATGWGGWTGFSISDAAGPLTLSGRGAPATRTDGYLTFGRIAETADRSLVAEPESPLTSRLSPAVARVFQSDRRAMTLTLTNTLSAPVSGWLEFELPPGLAVQPLKPAFGPLGPGLSADVRFTVVADNPAPGRRVVPYRVHYSASPGGVTIATGALALPVAIGPVLEPVYRHPQPSVYRVDAPRLTALLDMFHGLVRYLADDDDTVRLDGSPLFTFSDGEKDLLSEATTQAFTWPTESPAHLTAHTYDRARYNVSFVGDRMAVEMDPDWTQFLKTYFTVPGRWRSPQGPPSWARVLTVGSGSDTKVSAAELAFPGARWDLCFEFLPRRAVRFDGVGFGFTVDNGARSQWTVGFCQPETLAAWRWTKS